MEESGNDPDDCDGGPDHEEVRARDVYSVVLVRVDEEGGDQEALDEGNGARQESENKAHSAVEVSVPDDNEVCWDAEQE